MTQLYPSPVREGLLEVLSRARKELLLVSPYVKSGEMDWLLEQLTKRKLQLNRLRLVTDIRAENVLSGSLDLEALELLLDSEPAAQVINLPRLHAKVYIADASFALVTSANLTRPGMELNYEYGVGLDDASCVKLVRDDLELYSRIGNSVTQGVISSLRVAADEIRDDYREMTAAAVRGFRRKVGKAMAAVETRFLQAHVGSRSAHSLFADAILYCLAKRPATTRDLHHQIRHLLPELCDDSRDLIINGQHFGKKWKHVVRTAQVFLRRKGLIKLVGKKWYVQVSTIN